MRIQQIRNATLKIKYGSKTILVDPWLQDKGSGFSAKTIRREMVGIKNPMDELPMPIQELLDDVDFCLVTHIHPDHFSKDYLPKEIKIIVQNTKDKAKIKSMGFTNVIAIEDNNMLMDDISITKTTAVHGENASIAEFMGEACGYILKGEEKTLYIAGDTVYCEAVENTLEKYTPQVIILNCCEATTPIGQLIMGLNGVEAVYNKSGSATIIATHLDSVNHALVSSADVKSFAKAKGLKRLLVIEKGQWVAI